MQIIFFVYMLRLLDYLIVESIKLHKIRYYNFKKKYASFAYNISATWRMQIQYLVVLMSRDAYTMAPKAEIGVFCGLIAPKPYIPQQNSVTKGTSLAVN